MKKIILVSLLAVGGFAIASAQRYYPNDRNSQLSTDQYYYYPDDNVYYYPHTNNYIYYDQNRWCSSPNLPNYFRFNNSGVRISINYRGNSIWRLNNDHVRQYRGYNDVHSNANYRRNGRHVYSNPGRDNHQYNDRRRNQRNNRRNGRH